MEKMGYDKNMNKTSEKQIKANQKNCKLGGRPKGSHDVRIWAKKSAFEGYKRHVEKITKKLVLAQTANALGNTFLIRVDKFKDNETKQWSKKNTIVTDPDEIVDFLDQFAEVGSGLMYDKFYFMTTAKPDNVAIKDMMDRVYGKAPQVIATADSEGNIQPLDKIEVQVNNILKI